MLSVETIHQPPWSETVVHPEWCDRSHGCEDTPEVGHYVIHRSTAQSVRVDGGIGGDTLEIRLYRFDEYLGAGEIGVGQVGAEAVLQPAGPGRGNAPVVIALDRTALEGLRDGAAALLRQAPEMATAYPQGEWRGDTS